ncbi:MAG: helix-turn-helix domain-containing protein [Clostridia bacterium]|nr:helix-turn-helix domain-containing protein [Clostridia bacterium]
MNRTQSQMNQLFRLELMGHMITDQTWDGFVHRHDFDEWIYVMKGSITCHSGEQIVSFNKGDMLLLARNAEHRITAQEPAAFLYIGFTTNLLDVCQPNIVALDDSNPYLVELKTRLESIAHKVFLGEGVFADYASQVMATMIPAIASLSKEKVTQSSKEILSNQIKHYIKHHLDQPIRVDDIAAGLYHTPHYLGNVFSSVNGVTIKEYVSGLKMQKAVALLQDEQASVGQVAHSLGFDSTHYFSKCFKNYYGFSPSKLRNKE